MIFDRFSFINEIIISIFVLLFSYLFLIISPLLILINKVRNKTFNEPNNIIITGACGGLGSNLALRYAKPGNTLSLFGINNDNLNILKNKCIEQGANVEINIVDITDGPLLKEKLLDFDSRYSVDLLIANAGVIECQLQNETNFEEQCQRVINVNINGTVNTILPLIEGFESRGTGQIVIISSISCYVDHFYSAYSSSKSFCRSFGLNLRYRLLKFGVGVTIVTPGFINTPMLTSINKNINSISIDRSCDIIQKGIQMNLAQVYFPLSLFIKLYSFNIISPNLRDAWLYIFDKILCK